MSGTRHGFQLVDDAPPASPPPQQAPQMAAAQKAGTQMLVLALKALSQRAMTAISDLFSLILAGSVVFLFWQIISDPNQTQVICASIYAAFCLLLDAARRRNR